MTFFPDKEFKNRAMVADSTVECLEIMRALLGVVMNLTNDYADRVGHSDKSWHYAIPGRNEKAMAVDGNTEAPLFPFVQCAMKAGFTGIGLYVKQINGKWFVKYFHLDNRTDAPQMWVCVVTDIVVDGKAQEKFEYVYKLGGLV
jgi:hypothetical protein